MTTDAARLAPSILAADFAHPGNRRIGDFDDSKSITAAPQRLRPAIEP
jgi:hypothetical protein